MAAVDKKVLFPTGTTTASTGNSVELETIVQNGVVACQFVVEAVGATPTVTFKYQGSLDNVNWYDMIYFTDANDTLSVATRTVTGTGASVNFLDVANSSRYYKYYRCVTSSDTNVTYRAELYVFSLPR